MVRRIVENWSSARFKVPTCVRVDGQLHVVDGQHTCLAAVTHGGIAAIPVLVVAAPEVMLQQMAAVAELEAGMIGDRTKKALAAAKVRFDNMTEEERQERLSKGKAVRLGGNRGAIITAEQRAQGHAAQTARSAARATDLRPIITDLQAEGVTSLRQLAAALTERGIPTSRGADRWTPVQVSRVLRAGAYGS